MEWASIQTSFALGYWREGVQAFKGEKAESPAGRMAELCIGEGDAATEAAELAEYTSLESRLPLLLLMGN